jgi:membrane associated rhomboid family serine protease
MFLPYAIDADVDYTGRPWVVWTVCAACLAVHVGVYYAIPELVRTDLFYRYGCVPCDFHWWMPLTCSLLHGGWLHILGNLYFFWIYGRRCEQYLGTVRFLLLYLAGAWVSVGVHALIAPDFYRDVPAVGASGAIAAVLGAFLVLFPAVRIRFLVFSMVFSRPLPAQGPAWFLLGGWFLVQIVYGLQLVGDVTGVAFWAHIAGFAGGALVGSLWLLLHHVGERSRHRQAKRLLLDAWRSLRAGDHVGALDQFNAFRSLAPNPDLTREADLVQDFMKRHPADLVAPWRGIFAAARQENDHGRIVQRYAYFVNQYSPELLPGWVHGDAGLAALRMGDPDTALFALRQALLSDDVLPLKRILPAAIAALERLGHTEDATRLKGLTK